MQIGVFIEQVSGNGYRAKGEEPFAVSAEGDTPEEAIEKLRELIQHKLTEKIELVPRERDMSSAPFLRIAGIWNKDDPLVKEWKEILAENRRKANADPDAP